MPFENVQCAIADIRAGRMVILVDDEDRENEGDLTMAADKVTPEAINFMAKYGRGLICLTLTADRLEELNIPMMVADNTSTYGTAFTVSIEARHGVSTGISAADRAHTILTALHPDTQPDDLVRPGHIFPLRARAGGVLVRTGQTEGSVDLARLAGAHPSGVICEIMNDDGSMARMPDLEIFAETHGIRIVSIAELIEYRLAHDSLVRRVTSQQLTHRVLGDVAVHVYGTILDDRQHLVIVKGNLSGAGQAPLVRMHSADSYNHIIDDIFGSHQLDAALEVLGREPRGVLVCLDRDMPLSPLSERVAALAAPASSDSATADKANAGVLREFGVGAQILRDLGLHHIRLLSDHPRRLAGIEGYGLTVEEVVSLSHFKKGL